jgi:hypothetical protein
MLIPKIRTSAHYRLQAKHLREFLETVHNDDQLRAVLLDAAARFDRLADETAYRVHFVDGNGAILAREKFDASSDSAAIAAAELVSQACVETCHAFELWQGDRLVFALDQARASAALLPTDRQPLDIQQITLKLEESLQRSQSLIARSEKLISETRRLQERINPRGWTEKL